ncbi:hypothetical protein BVI2075_620007 [Burkholderia vietnamiensis]|nr:hypothetical protein BVI2075_620007 [Burkholderia vietnamiensis]
MRARRCDAAPQHENSGQKKPGRIRPRSNNDKRRMVTRRLRQPRTVKTDRGSRQKFEIFFDLLRSPRQALWHAAARRMRGLVSGRRAAYCCAARR